MNILIIGRGVSGLAAARLADKLNFKSTILCDHECNNPDSALENINLIIASPGACKEKSALFRAGQKKHIEIISELEFASRYLKIPYLAVTGTNGKTTTVELTAALLRALNLNACECGNIGLPLCDVYCDILEGKRDAKTIPVVEVSSFQLEECHSFAPLAAIILNIQSDHLDRYDFSMDKYEQAKLKIFTHVAPDKQLFGRSMHRNEKLNKFTVDDAGNIILDGQKLLNFNDCKIRGEHNLENLLAALELISFVVDLAALFSPELVKGALNFTSGMHRMEVVGNSNNILCINDSKATNPSAVIAALKTFCPTPQKNVHLILGGLDKGMDFSSLNDYADYVRIVYLIGQCQDKIYQTIHKKFCCQKFNSFDTAVITAINAAVSGDIVLMSPGCASMDMFKNYKERGERFRELVMLSSGK